MSLPLDPSVGRSLAAALRAAAAAVQRAGGVEGRRYAAAMATIELIDKDVIERVLAEALTRGGDFAEVFCEDKSSSFASMDQRKVEEIGNSRERGGGIRVVVGESTGFAHTSDLSEPGLLEAARTAASIARSQTSAKGAVPLDPIAVHPVRATVEPR